MTVETLDNNTFQPDRNYRVEITEAQGATVKDGGKTVETTISDNDPPSVPQMAAGSEPGSMTSPRSPAPKRSPSITPTRRARRRP